MTLRVLLCMWFVVAAAGCSQTHEVQRSAAAAWSGDATEDLTGEPGDALLADGELLRGEFRTVTAEYLQVLEDGTDRIRTVPLDSVLTMKSRLSVLAPIGGAVLGGLTGGLLGGALGLESGPSASLSGLEGMVNGAALGTVIGAAAGSVIVGVATMSHEYRIARPAP